MTRKWIFKTTLICVFLLGSGAARAGTFEFSLGASYQKTQYDAQSYNWSKRFSTSLGYYFTATSQIEFAYQTNTDRVFLAGYQDTTTTDQVLSVNWVQSIFSEKAFFQPYAKAGVGQLFREASGTYATGASPPARVDAVSAILGIGFRIRMSERFGVRAEATTYLTKGSIATFGDNVGYTAGASLYF